MLVTILVVSCLQCDTSCCMLPVTNGFSLTQKTGNTARRVQMGKDAGLLAHDSLFFFSIERLCCQLQCQSPVHYRTAHISTCTAGPCKAMHKAHQDCCHRVWHLAQDRRNLPLDVGVFGVKACHVDMAAQLNEWVPPRDCSSQLPCCVHMGCQIPAASICYLRG